MQPRLGASALVQEPPGAICIGLQVDVEVAGARRGKIQHIGEIIWQVSKGILREIRSDTGNADALETLTIPRSAEAAETMHLVMNREVTGDRERHLSRSARDQDLFVLKPLVRHLSLLTRHCSPDGENTG